jgi:hypothetical protein
MKVKGVFKRPEAAVLESLCLAYFDDVRSGMRRRF